MKQFGNLLVACLLLSACKDKVDGQVVATVNGEEITAPELNAAISKINRDPKIDAKIFQNNVLNEMITQRLVTQAAKEAGLDKSQSYILQARQAADGILVNLYGHSLTDSMAQPYDQDIKTFIAANPWRFSQRVMYRMDQLRVNQADMKPEWMAQATSLDDLQRILAAQNVAAERGIVSLDSANFERPDQERASTYGIGQPFPLVQGGKMFVSVILQKEPMPLNDDQARNVAVMLLQRKAAEKTLTNRIAALRKAAKIEYRQGFSAPKAASPATPPT